MTDTQPDPRTESLQIPHIPPDCSVYDAALLYIEAGLFILPVSPGTKWPGSIVGKDWQAKSSRSVDQITAWFAGGRELGIALHCGRSGIAVFDVDNPSKSPATLSRSVNRAKPPFQSTRHAEPARGHYLFAQPTTGRPVGNSTGSLGDDWGDVRGTNGVIIVAPSRHADPAGRYAWLRTGPVPAMPDALLEAVRATQRHMEVVAADDPFHEDRAFTLDEAVEYVRPSLERLAGARDGEINNRLNEAAKIMSHFGPEFWTREQAEKQLHAALRETIYDGRTWQAEDTIRSAYRSAANDWRAVPRPRGGDKGISAGDGVDGDDEGGADGVDYWLMQEVEKQRRQREARRILDAEERPPSPMPEVLSLAELLARPEEETRWRIHGWQPAEARVILAAQYKAGKTTTTQNVIRSLIDGDDFLGQYRVEPVTGTIAVLDFEMSQSQLRAWLAEQTVGDAERVTVISLRGRASAFNILDPEVRTKWAKILAERNVEYVILDCLRPVLDSLGLNEHTDAGRFLVPFDALLDEAGVSEAMVVHHMGHNGERSRGDSRIRDWPDVEWRLVRETDEPSSDRYISAFGRDVEQDEQRLGYNTLNRHLIAAGGTRRDASAEAALPAVLELLREKPGLSGGQVEKELKDSDHGQKDIRRALKLGLGNGALRCEKPNKRDTHYYANRPL